MFDDTVELETDGRGQGSSQSTKFRLSQKVEKILANQNLETRAHAARWAESLRFLTFDNDDDCIHPTQTVAKAETSKSVFTPDSVKGRCLPCENRVPIPSGHVCADHTWKKERKIPNRDSEWRKYKDPCVHVFEHTCKFCQHIPLFPNKGKVTRFRIRRVHPEGAKEACLCEDFVAISYCWSGEESQDEGERYKVVEEDGTLREMRAANSTIDRAVAFARENGFRMIWIDQECIEQDRPDKKELAIQAMDLVYVRAHTSIGLCHARLQQKHLNVILLAYESQSTHVREHRGKRALNGCRPADLIDMYEAISQIANDKWNTRAWILQEAFAGSRSMLLLFPRIENLKIHGWQLVCHELSQSEVAVKLGVIRDCLGICTSLVWRRLSRLPGTEASNRETLKRLQFFHPEERQDPMDMFRTKNKPRRTCNAAVALTYLKLRQLARVADKLAIVANMCDYELRLNTIKVEQSEECLAPCILVLSIINGDLSLLVPEVYPSVSRKTISFTSADGADFSWAHNCLYDLRLTQWTGWEPHGHMAMKSPAASFRLSKEGLSFPGTLWKRDYFVTLDRLQKKYAESWKRIRCQSSQSSQKTLRLAATHLLFEIIHAIVCLGEKELANSIWNSTSNWNWNRSSNIESVIESVDQFPPGLTLENRKGMFALEPDYQLGFFQLWVIDRVMNDGGLWAWSLAEQNQAMNTWEGTQEAETTKVQQGFSNTKNDHLTLPVNGSSGSHKQGLSEERVTDPSRSKVVEADNPDADLVFPSNSHAHLMFLGAMLSLISSQTPTDFDSVETENIRGYLIARPESLASFMLNVDPGTERGREARARKSVFDIGNDWGESPMVLTLSSMMLESIPRPTVRSMSTSWVVEETKDSGIKNDALPSQESVCRVRAKGMVRGMWQFSMLLGGRFMIV